MGWWHVGRVIIGTSFLCFRVMPLRLHARTHACMDHDQLIINHHQPSSNHHGPSSGAIVDHHRPIINRSSTIINHHSFFDEAAVFDQAAALRGWSASLRLRRHFRQYLRPFSHGASHLDPFCEPSQDLAQEQDDKPNTQSACTYGTLFGAPVQVGASS